LAPPLTVSSPPLVKRVVAAAGCQVGDGRPQMPPTLVSSSQGALSGHPVFHSFASLNPGASVQVLSGVKPGGQELQIGFEDLPTATGDRDCQDVVVGIHVTGDGFLT
jgi:hypothetical protein